MTETPVLPATRIHPETGKLLRRDVREQTVTFGKLSQTLLVPGWYPDDDSDAIHSGVDLKEWDDAFVKMRDEVRAASAAGEGARD